MGEIIVSIDNTLFEDANKVFDELGVDMETAIILFLKQTVIEQKLPFQVDVESVPDFLAKEEAISGKGCTFNSVEDLMQKLHSYKE